MRASFRTPLCLTCLCLAALGACRGGALEPRAAPPARADLERYARIQLRDARALIAEDRLDAAERALRRGIRATPEDPQIHYTLTRVLERLGRSEEAAQHRRRAEALDPPPPPPPNTALEGSSRGILVALLPPEPGDEPPTRFPSDWPDGVAAKTLEQRLRIRLPESTIAHASPESVAEARRWIAERAARGVISLRVDRLYCDDTPEDGPFAVAWIRAAAEIPGEPSRGPGGWREVLQNPRGPGGCRAEALARGLERVLGHPVVRRTLEAAARASAAQRERWSTPAIRALFPQIGARIEEELAAGRRQLASGRVAAAAATFRRAARIDPEDPLVLGYLHEAEATLALSRELAERKRAATISDADAGVLDPHFSAAQRARAEARLVEERRRREDLLAARAVLDEDLRIPSPRTIAALRPAEIRDPRAFGPATARERVGGEVESRAAYGPDGSELARYFFPVGERRPVLREEDSNGDGRPDRWVGYRDSARSDLWEDGRGTGHPDVHFVFAAGGTPIERIELDTDPSGRPGRILYFRDGVLRRESRDTNGDGVFDRFDHFDAEGYVETREEDLDGNGQIDIRSSYRAGKLVGREFPGPKHLPDDG